MSGMVCEHTAEMYANKTEIKFESKEYEGVRRTTKEHEGIHKDTKEWTRIRRNTKKIRQDSNTPKYKGVQRRTKEIRRSTRKYTGKLQNTRKIKRSTQEMQGHTKQFAVTWASFGWLALCIWRGSGERNGMRTYSRDVCEQEKNQT